MAHGDRRNADEALIAVLAGGSTVAAAAQQVGVSERTVWRRLQDDAFRQRLDAARQQTIQTAIDLLGKASTAAAATLMALLREPTPPAVRLGAARAILELGGKLRESQELEERIAALEERIAQQGQGRRRA